MADYESVRLVLLVGRWLMCGLVAVAAACAPSRAADAHAQAEPWFVSSVGAATQVVAVVGTGGFKARVNLWQRVGNQWQDIAKNMRAYVGSAGFSDTASDDNPATPRGIFTLDSAFGTEPAPPTGLPYTRVDGNDWWDVDSRSPTYNTRQHCVESACKFDTSVSENLSAYPRAIVMGVNPARVPRGGAAFFVHDGDGTPSAGCVTLSDDDLLRLMSWLHPGALIAIKG